MSETNKGDRMKTQKENVREYYWVTDIQLGLMTGVSSHKERKKVMEEVLEKQFIGNYPTESEFKEWINRTKAGERNKQMHVYIYTAEYGDLEYHDIIIIAEDKDKALEKLKAYIKRRELVSDYSSHTDPKTGLMKAELSDLIEETADVFETFGNNNDSDECD